MQLGKAESLGVFHDHQTGVGYVDTHLDDRCGHQNVDLPCRKAVHDCVLFLWLELAVHKGHVISLQSLGKLLCVLHRRLQGRLIFTDDADLLQQQVLVLCLFLDRGTDHVNLSSLVHVLANECVQSLAIALIHRKGVHALSAGRHGINARHGQIAVHHQRKRARDGGGTHAKQVRMRIFIRKPCTLPYAKAMLFIRNDKSGGGQLHTLGKQCLRADHHLHARVRILGGHSGVHLFLLRGCHRANQQRTANAKLLKERCKIGIVLSCQNFGRHHNGGLPAALYRDHSRGRGTDGFAASNVTHHHARHGIGLGHIRTDLLDRAALCLGQLVRQKRQKCAQIIILTCGCGDKLGGMTRTSQAYAKQQKLLEHQAPLGDLNAAKIGGLVHGPQGKRKRAKSLAHADILGNGILQPLRGQGQRHLHVLGDLLGGKPLGQSVDGMQGWERLALDYGLSHGRGHAVASAIRLHLTVKTENAAHGKGILHVVLIDIHDLAITAVVKRAELDQRHTTANHGTARLSRHGQHHGRLALPVALAKSAYVAAILISARKMIQQISKRKNAQLGIRRLLGGSDTAKRLNRNISDVLHALTPFLRYIPIISNKTLSVNKKLWATANAVAHLVIQISSQKT